MPYVRLTIAQKKLLQRAARALARGQGRPMSEGDAVTEGARRIIDSERLWGRIRRQDKGPPIKPGEVDPLFDFRIGVEGLSPTASKDVDEILYGRERAHRGRRGNRAPPAKARRRIK